MVKTRKLETSVSNRITVRDEYSGLLSLTEKELGHLYNEVTVGGVGVTRSILDVTEGT